jgi:hypothetical protein
MADGSIIVLPSGRTVTVEAASETIRVTSPTGTVELLLRLTPEGPMLVATGSLQLSVPEQLSLETGSLKVHSRGDMDFKADGEVHIEGTMIHLN